MKNTLTIIFTLLSAISFSQYVPPPKPSNKYLDITSDKFINKSSVEWAAYINYSIRFENPSLNKLLLLRFEKNEITATEYLWGSSRGVKGSWCLNKKELDDLVFHPHGDIPTYDSAGNQILSEPRSKRPGFDTTKFTKAEVVQILYIENGTLKSYIPWVTPLIPIITSSGVNLGDGGYFSTCFNFKYDHLPKKKNKSLFLAETTQVFKPDSIGNEYRLKELYGRNIIQTLWPYILKSDIEVYSTETNTKLNKKEINEYLLKKTTFPIPDYDSTGVTTGFQFPLLDFDLKNIIKAELVQDWYYNHKENIVFNIIKEMYLYVNLWGVEEEQEKSIPVLKIVFN